MLIPLYGQARQRSSTAMDQSSTCPTCHEPTLATDNWCASCGAPLNPAPAADWSAWDTARSLLDPALLLDPSPSAADPAPESLTADRFANPAPEIAADAAATTPHVDEPWAAEPGFIPVTPPAPAPPVSNAPKQHAPGYRILGAEPPDFVPLRAAIIDERQHAAPLARLSAAVRALRGATAR
jgi:hypothetical protein